VSKKIALGLAFAAMLSGSSAVGRPGGSDSTRALVGVVPAAAAAVERAIDALGGSVDWRTSDGAILAVQAETPVIDFIERLALVPGVRFAEPDAGAVVDATPNDERYAEQWGPAKISAPEAWGVTQGSDAVIVGIVDSGIDYTHPDLRARMWRNPAEIADGIDNDGNGFVDDIHGVDCRNRDGDPMDDNNHGTHVAGIIAADTNNGIGIAGVDRRARLMALKFLGADGRGFLSDAIRCIDYAIAHDVSVTNHSWGTTTNSRALRDVFARAAAADQIAVTSAGNAGVSTDTSPHYPSGFELDSIIAVGSSSQLDSLAASSNYGVRSVDIAAPGVGILSTVRGGYANKSGTSMATPHVTGTVALLRAAYPGIGIEAVRRRLMFGADRPSEIEGRVAWGRLNVARSLERDVAAPGSPALRTLGRPGGLTVAWLAPDDDARPTGIEPVAVYELRYRLRSGTSWIATTAPTPAPPGIPQAVSIDGLLSGKTYEVWLVAIDNVGNRSYPARAYATTA